MVELIEKKRNGFELSRDDYALMINGFISGEIPDYQVAAFLMAVYFKGLTSHETAILTDVMMRSGELIDLSEIEGIKVDKHSTGGVGDKTTLVLAPLVAAAGVPVAKMSGRGLGHTGGTLDKMESIKGLSVDMSGSEFIEKVKKHGLAICGQNKNLVPADKKLYALRDVTATVDNISLISSSIMSKKLACGADAILIDIKVGEGAYMKTEKEAEELANMIIGIGSKMNRKVMAVITAMDEPLGYAVGNALEVKEAIDTLKGKGPKDLTDLCLALGSHMLVLGGITKSFEEGSEKLEKLIASGAAFEKFKELVVAQGGDVKVVEQTDLLPGTQFSQPYKSNKEGYISVLNALDVGLAAVKLGAGRETKESKIDHGAGILLKKKKGDYVKKEETLLIMYSSKQVNFIKAKELLDLAFKISETAPRKKLLILKTIN
ncbi:MAG: pyrimidine-nucleoside phosphorylase [Saprospiraceae bacterium]|jgi:pyrimidine-nucleoside phosphorylase